MSKKTQVDPTLIAKIVDFVDSYSTNKGRFPSTQEIIKEMGVGETKCRRHIHFAITGGKLDYVYTSSKPIRAKVLGSMRIINHIKNVPEQPPSWVSSYSISTKAKMLSGLKKAEDELSVFTDLESLLWRKDKPLALACCKVLGRMGFKTEYKETEGDHDIEIADDQYFAIAEVTGSEHQIRISNADSLSRYYMKIKYEDENEKEVIPLLIGNAFHNIPVSDRTSPPFTASLVKATKKEFNYIHLMSSVELYKAIGNVLDGKTSKDDFRKSFKSGQLYYSG